MGQFQRYVEGVLPSELKAAWHSTTVITMLFFRTAIFSESIAASHLHSIASSSGMAAATLMSLLQLLSVTPSLPPPPPPPHPHTPALMYLCPLRQAIWMHCQQSSSTYCCCSAAFTKGVVHSFDDSQEHLEQLLAFPQVSIGDHCETVLLGYRHARGHVNASCRAGKLFAS